MYTCRECEKPINQATELCPYCGTDLTAAAPEDSQSPAREKSLLMTMLRLAVPLGALWGFLWYVLPEKGSSQAVEAEAKAVEALREVQAALTSYAEAEGQYPTSLEPLGAKARQPAQWAQREGYRLGYFPGAAGEGGRMLSYALVARPGNYGFRNFYVDQTGTMRATREDRQATADDPPI